MTKIIIMRGLPGSGKSTWVKKFIAKQKNWKRVNKDSLRECFDFGKYTPENEELINHMKLMLISKLIERGHNVIVDDTNLKEVDLENIYSIATQYGSVVKIKSFLNVPIDVCKANDLKRLNSVGADVIDKMYNLFIAPKKDDVVYVEDVNLPKAIICDIDGTVAKMGGRSPHEWDRVDEDKPNLPVIQTIKALKEAGSNIIFITGREGNPECVQLTIDWLYTYIGWSAGVDYILLFRADRDNRKDAVIKKELFENHIRGKYYIDLVIEDRDCMVELWRNEFGLTCFQCDYGNF